MSVLAYHPGTQASVLVADEAMPQLRRSGWLTKAEHDANEAEIAQRAEAAAAAEKAAKADAAAGSKPAGKTGKEN